MNELVNQLTQKAGLTEEQAIKAVDVIKEYIQGQLPPMMQGMVDNFMQGSNKASDDFLG
jgi:nucleoid DNA-binding protein